MSSKLPVTPAALQEPSTKTWLLLLSLLTTLLVAEHWVQPTTSTPPTLAGRQAPAAPLLPTRRVALERPTHQAVSAVFASAATL